MDAPTVPRAVVSEVSLADVNTMVPARYDDLGAVGRGTSGEVRRVRDRLLDRVLALKVMLPAVAADADIRRRFAMEVRVTAELQHPGVVPVYDHGELADGRLWYAMKEVRGTTLGTIIAELHRVSGPEGFGTTGAGWTFRRVIDTMARVAQTVAYAHSRGVMHRDLKPENLMAGEFGEVLVMDWGLARRVEDPQDHTLSRPPLSVTADGTVTHYGDVLGTPAYMPPEQARGQRELHGTHSDVYALGAILYHVLTGRPPFVGRGLDVVLQILRGPPPPVETMAQGGPPVPADLLRVCTHAMRPDPRGRCSADELAMELVAWLDGVRRREQALAVLDQARAMEPAIHQVRDRAVRTREHARTALAALKPYDPVDRRRPVWALDDEAAALGQEAALLETRWLQGVHAAQRVDPDLPEAAGMLADHYRAALEEAERDHRTEDATRYEAMLRAHDRGRYAAVLRGDGSLSLVTQPAGATVTLYRYRVEDRRLVPEEERVLGATPLWSVPVGHGSCVLAVHAEGHARVLYPVQVERGGHWDGMAPGETEPHPVLLPTADELGPDEVYVPAGWAWIGGDPLAPDSLPRRRVWMDGFVIQRFPVTVGEYLTFLNDLVAQGREEEALARCPRAATGATEGHTTVGPLARDASGAFTVPPSDVGPLWQARFPVVQVDWPSAMAYARWLAARTGQAWRLPNELEREKAARGVDGRTHPWGDHFDATFACTLEGHRGEPFREPVDGHPTDVSPYGVRGLAGNVRDWCGNVWRGEGPTVVDDRLVAEETPTDDDFRAVRGGAWPSAGVNGRVPARHGSRPGLRWPTVGFRLVRSVRDRGE